MEDFILMESPRKDKKFRIITPNGKKIDFGAKGYEDYTIHHDDQRKARYKARHSSRENWTYSGVETAGFWSLWLLWNKKTIDSSIEDIERRFDITISVY